MPFDAAVGDTITLNGSASSGLPVTYSLTDPAVCTLAGGKLTLTAVGRCLVTASQAGDSTWAPAPDTLAGVNVGQGYTARWEITTPGTKPRSPGYIAEGDRLTLTYQGMGWAIGQCTIRIATAGGQIMETEGKVSDGACTLSFTLPAIPDMGARTGDRYSDDICVTLQRVNGSDPFGAFAMALADQNQPGGSGCATSVITDQLDFQLQAGGTAQPFTSDPPMVSWNPADWIGYQPMRFGQTTHLQLPSFVSSCQMYVNGSWTTVISPASPAGCAPWDLRVPGVMPWSLPSDGNLGDWHLQIIAQYSGSNGAGQVIADLALPLAPSDGIFQSSQPAVFPTDLAEARFVTVGQEWTPSFQVAGAAPSDCLLEVLNGDGQASDYQATSISPDGLCQFTVPAFAAVGERHQYYLYSNTTAGSIVYGGSITTIPTADPPAISDPTSTASGTAIEVDAGAGQGLQLEMTVAPATGAATTSAATQALMSVRPLGRKAAPIAASGSSAAACSAVSVSTTIETGGNLPSINASCQLPAGNYVVTARMTDAAGAVVTSTKTFTVAHTAPIRYAGSSVFATAAAVSAATYASPCHCTAYVANPTEVSDTLAGSAAASKVRGPLLYVSATGAINSATSAELRRLQPERIVVLGGSNDIANLVMNALAKYAPAHQTVRLSGGSTFASAAAVSAATFKANCGCTVYVVQPNDFPEASTVAAAASANPGPVLFASSTGPLDNSTKTELKRLKPAHIVVLGTTSVISASVYNQLTAYVSAGAIARYSNSNLFAAAASVSSHSFAAGCGCTVYVTAGPDRDAALVAAAGAGADPGPLLFVAGTGALPSATATELLRLKPARIVVVGDSRAVSDSVVQLLAGYV